MIDATVHEFCRDAFLMARFGAPGDGRPEGRAWERAVSRGLDVPGLTRRQHAGTLGLFGQHGRSGAIHEIDGAGHGGEVGLWLEAKARAALDKTDVAAFAFKALDLYRQSAHDHPAATARATWWPVLVSSEPCNEAVRRSCMSMGVVLCDPVQFPLPTLLRVAGNPAADLHLDDRLLGETVRLGEQVCRPIQSRWRLDSRRRQLVMSLDEPSARDLGDLLFVQQELTGALLDHYEQNRPADLEKRGAELADRLRACSHAW